MSLESPVDARAVTAKTGIARRGDAHAVIGVDLPHPPELAVRYLARRNP